MVGRVEHEETLAAVLAGRQAYSPEEHLLLRLEALTGLQPSCAAEFANMYRCVCPLNPCTC